MQYQSKSWFNSGGGGESPPGMVLYETLSLFCFHYLSFMLYYHFSHESVQLSFGGQYSIGAKDVVRSRSRLVVNYEGKQSRGQSGPAIVITISAMTPQ